MPCHVKSPHIGELPVNPMRKCRHAYMTLTRCSRALLHSILYSFISYVDYLGLLSNGLHPMASDKQLFPPELGSALDGCKNLISVWQKYFQADTWPCEIIVCEMHPMCCTLNLPQ